MIRMVAAITLAGAATASRRLSEPYLHLESDCPAGSGTNLVIMALTVAV
jgi:hypothetical protein